jgi:hypothetical protein
MIRKRIVLLAMVLSILVLTAACPSQCAVVATGGLYVLLDTGQIYEVMFPVAGQAEFITNAPFAITETVYFVTESGSSFGLVTRSGHFWWYNRGGQGWKDYGYPMGQFTASRNLTWGEIKALMAL